MASRLLPIALASGFPLCAVGMQTSLSGPDNVVTLNVVALDSRGQPVTDLAAQDFIVKDSGKTREIAYVRRIDRRLTRQPTPRPGEFSNRFGSAIPHATVILLDLMNERFDTRSISANEIVKCIEKLDSAEFLYLYILTIEGRIYPVRGIPSQESASSLDRGPQWGSHIRPLMDAALRTVLRTRPVYQDVAFRTELTYNALESLASQLSIVPGRKNIVWVTDGVPITLGPIRSDTFEIVDFTPRLKHLSAALDRAQISIYPSRQIMVGSRDAPYDAPGVPHSGHNNGSLNDETLDQFAAMTGGRSDSGRDIGAAISHAMIDARTSYQLGYFVPEDSSDGKFHNVHVTCRRPGIRVQSKTGYYAWRIIATENGRQAMRTALSQQADSEEIGVHASLEGARLNVVIDGDDVALIRSGNRYKARLTAALVPYGRRGEGQPIIKPLDVELTAEQRQNVKSRGLNYLFALPSDRDISSLRLLVFDDIGQKIGSLTIPLPAH